MAPIRLGLGWGRWHEFHPAEASTLAVPQAADIVVVMSVQPSPLWAAAPASGYAVSVQADRSELASARRRRLVALGLLRALATAVVLVA